MFDFKFDWQPNMATGIQIVDTQHQQLLKMGRDVEQMIQTECAGVTEHQMLEFVCNLRNYAGYHLYTEESLMEECHYKKMIKHKAYHQKLVQMILQYNVRDLLMDSGKGLKELHGLFQNLLFDHMLTDDIEFAKAYLAYKKEHAKEYVAEDSERILEDEHGWLIKAFDATNVYLVQDQTYKGHVLVVYKEKRSSMLMLSALERNIFFADVARVADAIMKTMQPEALQYAYFEDIDDRLMMHIVPKYVDDLDFQKVFQMQNFHEVLKEETYLQIIERIRNNIK